MHRLGIELIDTLWNVNTEKPIDLYRFMMN